jgi:hypothetical protein
VENNTYVLLNRRVIEEVRKEALLRRQRNTRKLCAKSRR